jgi:subtilisin family serine protease
MDEKVNLIVQLKESAQLNRLASNIEGTKDLKGTKEEIPLSKLFNMDNTYGICTIPTVDLHKKSDGQKNEKSMAFEDFMVSKEDSGQSTYIIRGEVMKNDLDAFEKEMLKKKNVVGVFSDVTIETQLVCPGDGPVGTHLDVERLLCVPRMKSVGMDGTGVSVAIVDTGINMAYLNAQGKFPNFNTAWSWKPSTSTITPGSAPVDHGTMCAFDVCIAAPKCTLLDIALLSSTASGPNIMAGLLSDAIKAYEHLIKFIRRVKRPGENGSLVVNNSWGMFNPGWDYPVGAPGNYSHNPNHPFNLIVKRLALYGADIVFAAGNCGPECPDGRCQGITNAGIYGANSSSYVTSVAGVATNLDRVGYSNSGPGNLDPKKPDITGYTHFSGSGVYSADGGTSAACPVVVGVLGAIRTKRPFIPIMPITSPASIRNLIRSTANDLGASGYDYLYGYGVVNGCKIVKKLFPKIPFNFCDRYPYICDLLRRDKPRLTEFCKQYPHLCKQFDLEKIHLPLSSETETASLGQETDELDFLDAFNTFLSHGVMESQEPDSKVTGIKDECKCSE